MNSSTHAVASAAASQRGRHHVLWIRLILGRIGQAVLVIWAAVSLTFLVLRLTPGDPVSALLGGSNANPTPQAIAEVNHEYHFDQPLYVQYGFYMLDLAHGELGNSYSQHTAVTAIIGQQSGATLQLLVAALMVAWLFALASVLSSAGRRGQALASALEVIAATTPPFWLAIVLLTTFAFGLRWFPPAGSDGLRALILPALAMGLPLGGFIAQVTREAFDVALLQPFVLSARCRGLSDGAVRRRHVLRHAVLPGLSLSGWAIGALVSSALVVEVIFARQGLGRQLFQAVLLQDVPLASGITIFIAGVYVAANTLVDGLFRWVDPRLRKELP